MRAAAAGQLQPRTAGCVCERASVRTGCPVRARACVYSVRASFYESSVIREVDKRALGGVAGSETRDPRL